MIDYWITRRGIKRGNVPNPTTNLYGIYVAFMYKMDLPDGRPESYEEFKDMFRKWGVEERKIGKYRCLMLSKYVVPKSVMDPTARRRPPKPKRKYTRRKKPLPKTVQRPITTQSLVP